MRIVVAIDSLQEEMNPENAKESLNVIAEQAF